MTGALGVVGFHVFFFGGAGCSVSDKTLGNQRKQEGNHMKHDSKITLGGVEHPLISTVVKQTWLFNSHPQTLTAVMV